MSAWHITAASKTRRIRQSQQVFVALPVLRAAPQAVLQRWLKSHAQERAWQSLLDAAGKEALDLVDALRDELLQAGALAVKEQLKSGQWRVVRIVWRNLPAVQQAAGVTTADEHTARRGDLAAQWQALADEYPWLASAAQAAAKGPATLQAQRLPLLQALLEWRQAQRTGVRQDFALAARNDTKGITPAEWCWLEAHLPLEELGVGRFEPVLWLAGALMLAGEGPEDVLGLQCVKFVGLPCRQLAEPWSVRKAPARYWLIENRASFERQAAQLEPGVCLVWLPGRPSDAWMKAMRWLLLHAAAPAAISCDPDPAGIQIAMTAGELWTQAGLTWEAEKMAPGFWQQSITRPLNGYDRRVLSELRRVDLPLPLAQLRDYMDESDLKAEQEGWI